ncbi:MAG: CRISPR-associated endonuclease Cas2 [Chloracidobacterium sp.]|uniref:CRISPR-associated endoribonuclease Cas2 n=1 Tax=Chloracidobacterium validum TaxID=2821543 RepID=A0ABX8BEW1_9BACT|nr:CRISPR-associated endonuclease Cas2 [Chloracidobacterium validum]QUW04055.1 CRISPR-associated endonuclease Cas2 [Chloracidobacterium validum]
MPSRREALFVVAYDVVSDRRRNLLRKTLMRYGNPVQYSVFECWLTPERLAALQTEVRHLLLPAVDSIMYVEFCKGCARATRNLGVAPNRPVLPCYVF